MKKLLSKDILAVHRNFFSWMLLIFFTLILFIIIYKSEFQWAGKKRDYYFVYYIFTLSLIFLALIGLVFSKQVKEYITIFLVTIFVTFYSFEIFASLNPSFFFKNVSNIKEKSKIYKKKTGKKFDKRSRFEIYNDLKNQNNDVVVTIHPSVYLNKKDIDIFPLSSASNTKTILCNENGYYSIYESDRYGFNNPDDQWDQDQIEYMLIGDSFVHGSCVNRPDDVSSVLRNLSKKNILNLGYEGSGPLIKYATLQEYLKPNVKNILWFYTEINDAIDFKNELNNDILKKYLRDKDFSQNLKNKQSLINNLSRSILYNQVKKQDQFKFTNFLKLNKLRTFIHIYMLPEKSHPNYKDFKKEYSISILEFEELTKKFYYLAKRNNSKLYFIYLPTFYRYEKNFTKSHFEFIRFLDRNYTDIKSILGDLNIPIIDINKGVFIKEKNPLKLYPFEKFGHLNVEGYKKIANFIYTFTSKH